MALAIGFLTRLPVGRSSAFGAKDVARSARWFPLVGGLLGGISVAALWLLARVFPPLVTAVLIVAIDAALTGAMHFDGLGRYGRRFRRRPYPRGRAADHARSRHRFLWRGCIGSRDFAEDRDHCHTGREPPRNLRPRPGARAGPVVGRHLECHPGLCATAGPRWPPLRGSPTRFVGRNELIIATATAVALAAAVGRWFGAAGVLLVAVASIWWGSCCRRRIGGVTGDTLGAGIEISECLVLLLFTALR
jgi:adenosylcobinamide-GDP ribazoletransferase